MSQSSSLTDFREVSELSEPATLVAELDLRQNDVIRELDQLNQRIEEVIKAWTDLRIDEPHAGNGS